MIKNYTENLDYETGFKWIDVVSPTEDELKKIVADYSLDAELVLKCLAPIHLPKLQEENAYNFIVLRAYDESSKDGEGVQACTNKIVLFVSEKFLISIHRIEEPYLVKFVEHSNKNKDFFKQNKPYDILLKIFKIVILSFEIPLQRAYSLILYA